MTTLKQIIEESDKEFDQKFVCTLSSDLLNREKSKYTPDVIFIDDIPKNIKNFIHERDRKILEGVMLELERQKLVLLPPSGQTDFEPIVHDDRSVRVHNEAIDGSINLINQFLNEK